LVQEDWADNSLLRRSGRGCVQGADTVPVSRGTGQQQRGGGLQNGSDRVGGVDGRFPASDSRIPVQLVLICRDRPGGSEQAQHASLRQEHTRHVIGRVDPIWIVKGYLGGADGIPIVGCNPSDCHYQRGKSYARRRFVLLRSIFDSLGLEGDRFRLSWMSRRKGQDLRLQTGKVIGPIGSGPLRTSRL
jgi:coenzyme F420-reducing hydrogenase delta subunit